MILHTLQVGGGTLADIFNPEERGKAIAIYTLAPLFGPILGPIAGAWYVSPLILKRSHLVF